jgi:hypothetical protein
MKYIKPQKVATENTKRSREILFEKKLSLSPQSSYKA